MRTFDRRRQVFRLPAERKRVGSRSKRFVPFYANASDADLRSE